MIPARIDQTRASARFWPGELGQPKSTGSRASGRVSRRARIYKESASAGKEIARAVCRRMFTVAECVAECVRSSRVGLSQRAPGKPPALPARAGISVWPRSVRAPRGIVRKFYGAAAETKLETFHSLAPTSRRLFAVRPFNIGRSL